MQKHFRCFFDHSFSIFYECYALKHTFLIDVFDKKKNQSYCLLYQRLTMLVPCFNMVFDCEILQYSNIHMRQFQTHRQMSRNSPKNSLFLTINFVIQIIEFFLCGAMNSLPIAIHKFEVNREGFDHSHLIRWNLIYLVLIF